MTDYIELLYIESHHPHVTLIAKDKIFLFGALLSTSIFLKQKWHKRIVESRCWSVWLCSVTSCQLHTKSSQLWLAQKYFSLLVPNCPGALTCMVKRSDEKMIFGNLNMGQLKGLFMERKKDRHCLGLVWNKHSSLINSVSVRALIGWQNCC